MKWLIVVLAFVHYCESDRIVFKANEVREYPGKCFDVKNCVPRPTNTSWPIKSCGRASCEKHPSGKLMEIQETCPRYQRTLMKGCHFIENKKLEFPECCPRIKCPKYSNIKSEQESNENELKERNVQKLPKKKEEKFESEEASYEESEYESELQERNVQKLPKKKEENLESEEASYEESEYESELQERNVQKLPKKKEENFESEEASYEESEYEDDDDQNQLWDDYSIEDSRRESTSESESGRYESYNSNESIRKTKDESSELREILEEDSVLIAESNEEPDDGEGDLIDVGSGSEEDYFENFTKESIISTTPKPDVETTTLSRFQRLFGRRRNRRLNFLFRNRQRSNN